MRTTNNAALSPVQWLTNVLGAVAARQTGRVAGLGLVLYRPPLDLPVTGLVPPELGVRLPCKDLKATVELLSRLSDADSALHDGFHLIDASRMELTHVCHFFAPPIPDTLPDTIPGYAVGARFMAALLGSLLPSVVMTAVMGDREGAIAIERGLIRPLNVTN